jgi:hypothetical protein
MTWCNRFPKSFFSLLPAVLCWGCGGADGEGTKQPPAGPSTTRETVYSRTALEFARAELFTPKRRSLEELDFNLAPLILQQVKDVKEPGDSPDPAGRIGGVTRESGGRLRLDRERPAVYYSVSTARLQGRDHRQIAYLWFCGLDGGAGGVQGVRLTLDSLGFPVIFEVLADTSGMRIFYVSSSLERSAAREFGAPLAGRRCAVERSVEERPRTVVARVLKDAPEPLGPFVYQLAGSRDVSTLLCRCMASQVAAFRRVVKYDFVALAELEELGVEDPGWSAPVAQLEPDVGDDRGAPDWLERCLRLPRDF